MNDSIQQAFSTVDELHTAQNRATKAEHALAIEADRRKIAEAERDQLRRERDEIRRVLIEPTWKPVDRLTLAAMRLTAQPAEIEGWQAMPVNTVGALAEMIGMAERSTYDVLGRLCGAGLIDQIAHGEATNKHGQPIERKHVDKSRGDKYINWSDFHLPGALPQTLPQLAEGNNRQAARETQATKRREFADLKVKLDNMLTARACPSCGEVGTLHATITATCDACKTVLTEATLAELIDGEAMPEISQTLRNTPEGDRRRALRDLRGIDTPPAPGVTYDYDEDAGGELTISQSLRNPPDPISQDSQCLLTDTANLAKSPDGTKGGGWAADGISQTLRIDDAPGDDFLTGADSLDHLAALGATFTLLRPNQKRPYEISWQLKPHTLTEAVKQLIAGGNVGMLTGVQSGQLCAFDIDAGLAVFFGLYPGLAVAPIVYRDNAPDRAKVLFWLDGDDGEIKQLMRADAKEGYTRKIEYFCSHGDKRQIVVAGTHESGAEIKLRPGYSIPVLTPGQVVEIMRAFVPIHHGELTQNESTQATAPRLSANAKRAHDDNEVRAAIYWFDTQPDNVRQAEALIEKCPRDGKYFALRKEHTPSVHRDYDNYDRWMLTDFGTGEKLDALEVICLLDGRNKAQEIRRILAEYRASEARV